MQIITLFAESYLANLSLYPAKSELPFLPPNTQVVMIFFCLHNHDWDIFSSLRSLMRLRDTKNSITTYLGKWFSFVLMILCFHGYMLYETTLKRWAHSRTFLILSKIQEVINLFDCWFKIVKRELIISFSIILQDTDDWIIYEHEQTKKGKRKFFAIPAIPEILLSCQLFSPWPYSVFSDPHIESLGSHLATPWW